MGFRFVLALVPSGPGHSCLDTDGGIFDSLLYEEVDRLRKRLLSSVAAEMLLKTPLIINVARSVSS